MLDTVAACIEQDQAQRGELPAQLSQLQAHRQGCPTTGPWGGQLLYTPDPEHGYALCVIGPDGKPHTHDDLCREPDFIYFQF